MVSLVPPALGTVDGAVARTLPSVRLIVWPGFNGPHVPLQSVASITDTIDDRSLTRQRARCGDVRSRGNLERNNVARQSFTDAGHGRDLIGVGDDARIGMAIDEVEIIAARLANIFLAARNCAAIDLEI